MFQPERMEYEWSAIQLGFPESTQMSSSGDAQLLGSCIVP